MPKMPFFFIGKSYWKSLIKFFTNKMLKEGMIKKEDLKIFKVTDDVREVVLAANKIGHLKIDQNIYNTFKSV